MSYPFVSFSDICPLLCRNFPQTIGATGVTSPDKIFTNLSISDPSQIPKLMLQCKVKGVENLHIYNRYITSVHYFFGGGVEEKGFNPVSDSRSSGTSRYTWQ